MDIRIRALVAALALAPAPGSPAQQIPADPLPRDLTELSLAELASLRVTSVSKRTQSLSSTPAAVQVISHEEIRRSGASSIPELLRRAPGVHVAQGNASQWAIGIRGFTSGVARAQLALLDGRSLYTPLFAGTYWDVQNVMLEDVERIEVVRGPGGTLWGANAVNGVVSILTKSAADTQGGLLAVGAGNEERFHGRARQGGKLGARGSYRVYAMHFDRDAAAHASGADFDGWRMSQGGFRSDWTLGPRHGLTVQGDLYDGRAGQRSTYALFEPPFVRTSQQEAELNGSNLLARFTRGFQSGSELVLQVYHDRTRRQEVAFRERRDTLDFDAQYRLAATGRHQLVGGVGYRVSDGRTVSVPAIAFTPADRTDQLATAFLQDSAALVADRLRLELGVKLEHNDYSGLEVQPAGRLAFTPNPRHTVWAAVTRAVRTPTRFDRDLALSINAVPGVPVFARLLGDSGFAAERTLSYEAGYRALVSSRVSLDVAAFHARYPNLVSYEAGAPFVEPGARVVLPLRTANLTRGTSSGLELSADVRPRDGWLMRASYSFLQLSLEPGPGSTYQGSGETERSSPRHQAKLWCSLALPGELSLDGAVRWVSRLEARSIKSYAELDLRLAWAATTRLELGLVGKDLLHARHAEFDSGSLAAPEVTEIQRSVRAEAAWRW